MMIYVQVPYRLEKIAIPNAPTLSFQPAQILCEKAFVSSGVFADMVVAMRFSTFNDSQVTPALSTSNKLVSSDNIFKYFVRKQYIHIYAVDSPKFTK